MATGWMRKNRRIVLAVLVVFLMVAWGALPALRYLMEEGGRTFGEIRGEKIGAMEMRQASGELGKLQQYRLLQKDQGIGSFILQGDGKSAGGTDAVWRYLVLVHEARHAGIHVMVSEYANLFRPNGPLPADDAELRHGVVNLIKISKLLSFQRDITYVSTAQQWMDYNYEQYEVDLDLVQITPSIFLSEVNLNDEEVRDFYEEHKNISADPASGQIGYKAPARAKLEYAIAPIDEYTKKVSVSNAEIREYYEEHKEEYKVAESSSEEMEGESGETAQQDNDGDDKEESEKTDSPEYKPLDEVREEIENQLATQKAEKVAREKVEKMLDDLDATTSQFLNEPHPVEQMAKRYDCQYGVTSMDSGRQYLSREEIQKTVPGGRSVAERVFDEALEVYYYSFVDTQDGPMVVQILDRKEAQPEPFSRVEAQVRNDLRREKALGRANTFAKKLAKQARQKSLSEAVKVLNGRLVSLLGEPPQSEGDSKDQGENEADVKEDTKDNDSTYIKLHHVGFVPRSRSMIEAVEARCPTVLNEATLASDGEIRVVSERGQGKTAVYVFEKKGGRMPEPAGFWPWKQRRRFITMFRAPREQLQRWLDGLMEQAPLPSSEDK